MKHAALVASLFAFLASCSSEPATPAFVWDGTSGDLRSGDIASDQAGLDMAVDGIDPKDLILPDTLPDTIHDVTLPDLKPDVPPTDGINPDADLAPNDAVHDALDDAVDIADDGTLPDVPWDQTPDADTLGPECPGAIECPCVVNSECNSGICLLTPEGSACSGPCDTDTCPEGWYCTSVVEAFGVVTPQCVPYAGNLCRPCFSDIDCVAKQPGKQTHCLQNFDKTAFCAAECDPNSTDTCPPGYECKSTFAQTFLVTPVCLPVDGTCDCTQRYAEEAASTDCLVQGETGTVCEGVATCGPQGLGDCLVDPGLIDPCDGVDNNCNGVIDDGALDTDQDAQANCVDTDDDGDGDPDVTDCAPLNPAIHHAAAELCNGVDDNCDNIVDGEGASGCVPFYQDLDKDGFGGASKCLCQATESYALTTGGDCNDNAALVNPNAVEQCATPANDDCDTQINEPDSAGCTLYYTDADGDFYTANLNDSRCLCQAGDVPGYTATLMLDCNDGDPLTFPGSQEVCGGGDEDCDTQVDEPDAKNCASYYYDLDGDLWGISGSPLKCLCKSNDVQYYTGLYGGDCDDTRADVKPNLPDSPDTGLTFLDANCDGIDGEVNKAVFVSTTTGLDSNSCVAKSTPCKTIAKGIDVAKAQGRSYVLIADGTYLEAFYVVDGISLYGGYSATDWSRNLSNVTLVEVDNVAGIRAESITLNDTILNQLIIQGKTATNGSQRNSIAFQAWLCDSHLKLIRVSVLAGNGFKGNNGGSGTNGAGGAPGNKGTNANGGTGGVPQCSTLPVTVGTGGAGGGAFNCGSAAGKPGVGLPASPPGSGGTAGVSSCGGCDDWGGSGGAATGGAKGAIGDSGKGCSLAWGTLVDYTWSPGQATSGAVGAIGAGGGGGGSGGTDVDPAACVLSTGTCLGAGGGGGGSGGCAGTEGNSGTGGGASVAILLIQSAIQISDSFIQLGVGGDGGNGGKGGSGGKGGGGGGPGSPSCSEGGAGGNGGSGGDGGGGGGGGGGCGGPAIGIGYKGTGPTMSGVTYAGGSGGDGGDGGAHGDPGYPAASSGSTGGKANVFGW